MKICVFSSGNGTDLEAILTEMQAGRMPEVELCFVLVNKECGAAKKARLAGVPLVLLDPMGKDGLRKDRIEFDREILEACESYQIDLIVLVGWMRILSPWFVKQYPKRILNVHPSLLPKYPGMDLDVHTQVLENGEKESGMTIHYVDVGVDSGEIILQKSVGVEAGETVESLKEKVQELEKEWYPKVILSLVPDLTSTL